LLAQPVEAIRAQFAVNPPTYYRRMTARWRRENLIRSVRC
jgi:hypothetical protein